MIPQAILATTLLFNPFAVALQDAPQSPEGEVVVVRLSKPTLTPLARQANLEGEVVVAVTIRPDGTADAAVVSGHPMLRQSALDSALQSKFECHHCANPVPYSLVYKFIRTSNASCCGGFGSPVKVEEGPTVTEQGRLKMQITVSAEKICLCDPAADAIKRVRSLRCLYLWKCSVRG